jgi:CRISPR-associated protein Cas1
MRTDLEIVHGWRGPFVSVFCPEGGRANPMAPLREAQTRIAADPERRLDAAKAVLRGALASFDLWRRRTRQGTSRLKTALRQTLWACDSAASVDELLGLEGTFHRLYLEEWVRHFGNPWGFYGRNRRPPRDPVNALLSYGNSIIYSLCVPPLAKAGLHTAVGFLHEPGTNRHTLALDMAELVKPLLADLSVWRLLDEERFTPDMATTTADGCLLNVEGRKLLRNAMTDTAKEFFAPRLIKETFDTENRSESLARCVHTPHPSLAKKQDRLRCGWPVELWTALEETARTIARDIAAEKLPQAWRLLPDDDDEL